MHFIPAPGINRVEQDRYYYFGPSVSGVVRNSAGAPLTNVKVQVFGLKGQLLATLFTDQSGFYHEYSFKLNDKSQSFTAKLWNKLVKKSQSVVVRLPDYAQQQTVVLKADNLAFADFIVETGPKVAVYA